MADIRLSYATPFNASITLASLVSDGAYLQGRESTAIVNSSGYLDYLISGKITTGSPVSSGTAIEVWAVGSVDGTVWPDAFDGVEGVTTVTSTSNKVEICKLVASISIAGSANYAQWFGPISLAALFGGTLPKSFVLFVINGTGSNLNATSSNHQIRLTPVYETVG